MAAVHKKLRAGTELIESQQPVDTSTISVSNNLILCTDCGTQVSKQAITCPNCGTPIGDADVSKDGGGDYGDDDYLESEYEEYISQHPTRKPKQKSKNRKHDTNDRTSSDVRHVCVRAGDSRRCPAYSDCLIAWAMFPSPNDVLINEVSTHCTSTLRG
jgi:hypothetical protein